LRQPLKAALHLKAGPICCVRYQKFSLLIGQKVEITLNPFTPSLKANLVEWILYSKKTWFDMVWTQQIIWIKYRDQY